MEIMRELPIVDAYHFDNNVEEGEQTQIQVAFVPLAANNPEFTENNTLLGAQVQYKLVLRSFKISGQIRQVNHIKDLRKHNRLLDTCRNLISLVLEDEITDEQIDILIEQIYKVVKYILTSEDLNDIPIDLRKQMAINFLSRQGSSICSAGSRMFMLDTSDKVYACHRMNTFNSDDLELYDIKDNEIKNIDFYLSFMKFNSIRYHYGAIRNIDKPNCRDEFWIYICPATSFNVSNSVFMDPAKFNVLQSEVHRAVIQIADYFDLDLTKNTDRIKELRKRGKNKK